MIDKYEKEIKEIWSFERLRIKNEIKKLNKIPDDLLIKIKLFVKRTFIDEEYEEIVINELLKGNDFILSVLMKDPKRQNVYEKILLKEFLDNGINAKKLPSSGKGAFYAINGKIVSGSELDSKPLGVKSFDFLINFLDKKIFVVHKYTKENGGAQDNQFHDVISTLKNLNNESINNVLFCLDGEYYNDERINKLREYNPSINIVNIENIVKKIESML